MDVSGVSVRAGPSYHPAGRRFAGQGCCREWKRRSCRRSWTWPLGGARKPPLRRGILVFNNRACPVQPRQRQEVATGGRRFRVRKAIARFQHNRGDWFQTTDRLNPIQAVAGRKVARASRFTAYRSHTSHILRFGPHKIHRFQGVSCSFLH
jgi:hypothetical protein